jgi:peptide/nickel transport system substrate-binding protein
MQRCRTALVHRSRPVGIVYSNLPRGKRAGAVSVRRRTALGAAMAAALPFRFAIAQSDKIRVLRFVPQANLSLLDPIFTSAGPTICHGFAIYDMLFGINAKREPRPQMAEGHTLSDDGRTYLIRLREGLRFHNGEPVRAQDCAPSLTHWAAKDTLGQTVWQYVESCGAQDDRTVKVVLKQPIPIFIEAIARGSQQVPFIMPEHVAKTDPYKQNTETIGSGPYRFLADEFVSGAHVAYARFADYVPRPEPAEWTIGGKVAHFDRVEWRIIPDATTATAALRTGEVDWYEVVEPDLVPMLRKNADIRIAPQNPTGYSGVLRFNHLHPPFDNVKVRRAVLMGLRQTDYMQAVTGGDASAYQTCRSWFPCGSYYGADFQTDAMQGDSDKARAMLAASGYNGERAVIINPTDLPSVGPLGNITYDLLRRMGMNVEMAASDWGTVVQRRNSREPVEKGGWSIFHTYSPGYTRYTPMEYGSIRGQGMAGFFGWYRDDAMEAMTRRFVEAPTQAERDAIVHDIQARAFEMVPSAPLGTYEVRMAYRADLVGVISLNAPYFWNVHRL